MQEADTIIIITDHILEHEKNNISFEIDKQIEKIPISAKAGLQWTFYILQTPHNYFPPRFTAVFSVFSSIAVLLDESIIEDYTMHLFEPENNEKYAEKDCPVMCSSIVKAGRGPGLRGLLLCYRWIQRII